MICFNLYRLSSAIREEFQLLYRCSIVLQVGNFYTDWSMHFSLVNFMRVFKRLIENFTINQNRNLKTCRMSFIFTIHVVAPCTRIVNFHEVYVMACLTAECTINRFCCNVWHVVVPEITTLLCMCTHNMYIILDSNLR